MIAETIKLYRTNEEYGSVYQTEPLSQTGIGRFQVYKTDNSNARAIGRQPKWKVSDLYANVLMRGSWAQFDTLAEVREWIASKQRS